MKSKTKWKPNTQLPKGGVLLKRPVTKKLGGWNEMAFDAKVERYGLTLLRVRGGFDGTGSREDWVIDLPTGCYSVSDYHFRREMIWVNHLFFGSFDNAVKRITKWSIIHLNETITETRSKLADQEKTLAVLQKASRR